MSDIVENEGPEIVDTTPDPHQLGPNTSFYDVVEEFSQKQYPHQPVRVVNGTSWSPGGAEGVLEAADTFIQMTDQEQRRSEEARVQNAYLFSKMFRMDYQDAYRAEPEIRGQLYQGEKLSSETFLGRMRLERERKDAEIQIAMHRFAQLYGDSSQGTEDRIQDLRRSMPQYSRLEEFTNILTDKNEDILNRGLAALGATPYVFSSQLPMWVQQWKYGAMAGVMGMGLGFASGGSAFSYGAKGFLVGGALFETVMEAGMMYDEIITYAEDNDIEIDKTDLRRILTASSAVISTLDAAAFGNIVSRISKKPTEALVKDVLVQGVWKKYAMQQVLRAGAASALEESSTEFAQEIVGNLAIAWADANNRQEGRGALNPATVNEMFTEAAVAAALSAPMAFFLAGGGSTITTSRSLLQGNAALKQAETDLQSIKDAEETIREADGEVELDFAEGEDIVVTVDDDLEAVQTETVQTPLGPQQQVKAAPAPKKVAPVAVLKPLDEARANTAEGLKTGDYEIYGRTRGVDGEQLVFIRQFGAAFEADPIQKVTVAEAAEMTGRTERTVLDKARRMEKERRNAQLFGVEERTTPLETLRAMAESKPIMTAVEKIGTAVAVLDQEGYVRAAFTEQQVREILEQPGSEVLGEISNDGTVQVKELTKIVAERGWNKAFSIQDGKFANTKKARAITRAEKARNKAERAYEQAKEDYDNQKLFFDNAVKNDDKAKIAEYKTKVSQAKKAMAEAEKNLAESGDEYRAAVELKEPKLEVDRIAEGGGAFGVLEKALEQAIKEELENKAAERKEPRNSAGHEKISGTSEETTQELVETLERVEAKNMKMDPTEDSMPAGLKAAHRVDYKGQIVRSAADLAVLFSAFRSLFVETAHVVFMQGETIVGKNTISSGRKTHTVWYDGEADTDLKAIRDLEAQMEALGADGFYLVHNHPSGNPDFSQADTRLHMKMRTVSPSYKGAVITNGMTYSYQMRDDPDFTSDRYGHGWIEHDAVTDITKDRETVAFVLSKGIVVAVHGIQESTTNTDIENVIDAYGGEEVFVTTTSQDSFDIWEDNMTIDGSRISRVARLEQDGVLKSQAKSEDPAFETSPRLSPLMDSEKGPVPQSVKSWKYFWNNLVNKYHLTRPQGLSVTGSGQKKFNVDTMDGKVELDARADQVDGLPVIRLKMTQLKVGGESADVMLSVSQDKDGVGVGIRGDQELTLEQDALIRRYMGEIAEELYFEGTDYSAKNLDLSDDVKQMISNYSEFKSHWKLAPILEKKPAGKGLKDMIIALSDLMVQMDENGQQSTNEFQAIKTLLWEMGKTRVQLEGMASLGISKLKKKAAMLARSVLTPSRLQAVVKGKLDDDFKVRLPLTKNELIRYEKLKAMSDTQLSKERNGAQDLAYFNLPGIESLSFNQLKELSDQLDLYDALRLKATMANFNGHELSLNVMISRSLGQLNKYRPDEAHGIQPNEMNKRRRVWNAAGKFLKDFMIDRQTQFFFLTEHIAGRNSYIHHLLYRNLEQADRRARLMRHKHMDIYNQRLRQAGITQERLAAWSNEDIAVGGATWHKGQALAIYMHSLAESNWKSIQAKGMQMTDRQGHRYDLHPDIIDFQAVADAVASDPIGSVVGTILGERYADLGDSIKSTYETMFGKSFEYEVNYYPQKVAESAYNYGETEVGKAGGEMVSEFLIKEKGEDRISLAKAFLIERTGETHQLRLEDAFETFNISMEQGTKFIHMELPFFQASKLIFDPDFKQAMINKKGVGEKGWRLIADGLQDWAGRRMDIKNTWDQVFLFARRQATRAGLGLNPFSALKATISFLYGMRYMPMNYAMRGMVTSLKTRDGLIQKYMKLSPVFRDRVLGGALPEINDIMAGRQQIFNDDGSLRKKIIVKGNPKATYDNILFGPITAMDKGTVAAVMEGAVTQALDSIAQGNLTEHMKLAMNMDEAIVSSLSPEEKVQAAVTYAEYVIQRTQPDFRPQSRNQFQRGTPIERLASVYGSFVTVSHNMFVDLAHRIKHDGVQAVGVKEIATTLALAMATSMGAEGVDTLKRMLLNRKEADWWEMAIRASEINNIFVVRDIGGMVVSKVKYGEFAGHGNTNAYTRFMDQIITGAVGTVGGAIEGNDQRMVRGIGQMAEGISSLAGLPVVFSEYTFEGITSALE
jgi:hypothetical protein